MTDRYADLRAALDAGPTPGPWDYGADPCLNNEAALAICKQNIDAHTKPSSGYFFVVYVGDGRRTALVGHGPDGEANARLIAAANPETIRALLADYDRMRDALNGAVAVAREAHAHWDADRDAKVGKLLLALSGYALGYDPRTDAVQTALAQEQGGSYERPR
jgi:hypothetical protein